MCCSTTLCNSSLCTIFPCTHNSMDDQNRSALCCCVLCSRTGHASTVVRTKTCILEVVPFSNPAELLATLAQVSLHFPINSRLMAIFVKKGHDRILQLHTQHLCSFSRLIRRKRENLYVIERNSMWQRC